MRAFRVIGLSLLLVSGGICGCSRPSMPSLDGPNKFHDITQVKKGMSANEVRRVMGTNYQTVFEEGIQGADGGNYIYDYPQGRVYFYMDSVTRVVPAR